MEQGPCEAVDGTLGSATFASLGKAWDHFSHCRVRDIEISWDVGPFAAGLQCLHLDTPLFKHQNIKKLHGIKNHCMHTQLGQLLDKRHKETKKPICHFGKAQSKTRGLGAKAGYCTYLLHAHHLSHPSGPTLDRTIPSPHVKNKLPHLSE